MRVGDRKGKGKAQDITQDTHTDLKAARQELVLHLQVVPLVHLRLKGLVEDGVAGVVLDVLPACIAMSGAQVTVKELLKLLNRGGLGTGNPVYTC